MRSGVGFYSRYSYNIKVLTTVLLLLLLLPLLLILRIQILMNMNIIEEVRITSCNNDSSKTRPASIMLRLDPPIDLGSGAGSPATVPFNARSAKHWYLIMLLVTVIAVLIVVLNSGSIATNYIFATCL